MEGPTQSDHDISGVIISLIVFLLFVGCIAIAFKPASKVHINEEDPWKCVRCVDQQ